MDLCGVAHQIMEKTMELVGKKQTLYQIDAFTDKIFSGNPAAVVPLDNWISEKYMQSIAMENNLSETAFIVKENKNYSIRWYTPNGEVDLCGHATLASAFTIFNYLEPNLQDIEFISKSGLLTVTKNKNELIMNFPKDIYKSFSKGRAQIQKIIGLNPQNILKGKDDILVILSSQSEVEKLKPNFELLSRLDCRGLVVSAQGEKYDFVSRCFYPKYGVDEDPVTGSAHCLLAPYWSEVLSEKKMSAYQLSYRGGKLICEVEKNRVKLSGTCAPYMIGEIRLD